MKAVPFPFTLRTGGSSSLMALSHRAISAVLPRDFGLYEKGFHEGSLLMELSGQKLLRIWISEEPERGRKFISEKALAAFEMETSAPTGFIFSLTYVSFSKSLMVFYEAQHSWDSWDMSHPLHRGEFKHSASAQMC